MIEASPLPAFLALVPRPCCYILEALKKTDTRPLFYQLFGLHDEAPDADGLYNGVVLPPGPAALCFVSVTSTTTPAMIVAYSYGHNDLGSVILLVLITSILFWYKPTVSAFCFPSPFKSTLSSSPLPYFLHPKPMCSTLGGVPSISSASK